MKFWGSLKTASKWEFLTHTEVAGVYGLINIIIKMLYHFRAPVVFSLGKLILTVTLCLVFLDCSMVTCLTN